MGIGWEQRTDVRAGLSHEKDVLIIVPLFFCETNHALAQACFASPRGNSSSDLAALCLYVASCMALKWRVIDLSLVGITGTLYWVGIWLGCYSCVNLVPQ